MHRFEEETVVPALGAPPGAAGPEYLQHRRPILLCHPRQHGRLLPNRPPSVTDPRTWESTHCILSPIRPHGLDVASGLGTYDLYYLDQSWIASFSGDVLDPREKYDATPDLAMPGYDFDDFLKTLVDGISMYKDVMVGVPYDIPIFIQMYRSDIFDELTLKPATTMAEFVSNAQAIQKAKGPGIYGTTGQMKSGHYSLECDWTAWLWGHGGSIFGPDGKFTGNDEPGIAAVEYWQKLKENMPPGVTDWTWDDEGQSVRQGIAGTVLSWGEFFPAW